jgi:integrase
MAPKDRRLLIKVNCSTRNFYLSPPPPGRCDWHVRFSPPADVCEALGIGRRISRTTGSSIVAVAKKVAAQILESFWPDKSGVVQAMKSVKARELVVRFPLLAEVLKCFERGAQAVPDKNKMRDETVRQYIRSIERIVETRFDAAGRVSRAKGAAAKMTIAEAVDPKLWNTYKEKTVEAVGSDKLAQRRAQRRVNHNIGNARSIFGLPFLRLYSHLQMPDLRPLREQVQRYQKVTKNKFRAIPLGTLKALEAEVEGLRAHVHELDAEGQLTRCATDARGMILSYYMAMLLGMRRSEVLNARLDWISEFGPVARMQIVETDLFDPKGTEGAVNIAPKLMQDIRDLSGAVSPDDYLIPGPCRDKTWRKLSKIVRKYVGAASSKTLHQLRKQAISNYLMVCGGNYAEALKFSRHADPDVLHDHYEDFLGDMHTLGNSDWRVDTSNVIPLISQQGGTLSGA